MKPEKLFRRAYAKKQEAHWPLCLAAYYLSDKKRMADELLVVEQTVINYAKTYCLYKDLREWIRAEFCQWADAQVRELRELRAAVDYSKWLKVAERVYHIENPIELWQALDFLRAGADSSFRVFAAIVGGNNMTRTSAFKSAFNALRKALSFPMPKRDKRVLNKAMKIVEKRGK